MKTMPGCLAMATMLFVLGSAPARCEAPDDLRAFMRAKLMHAQELLEGLTTNNFTSLAKHSQEMALLSQAANWNVLQTKEYLQHSIEFRRAANALTKAATDENLEGATLAYVDMTMKCVVCHKYVRGVRTAQRDLPIDTYATALEAAEKLDGLPRLENRIVRSTPLDR